MVTDQVIGASDIGKTFAEAIQKDPAVVSVWARRYRDVFEIWVLTEPIEADHERRLFEAVSLLHEIFPDAMIRCHLINPMQFDPMSKEELLAEMLPPNAELIPIRREA